MNSTLPPEEDPSILFALPGGSIDLGFIDAAAAKTLSVSAGPIRLLNGMPGKKGWGLRHLTSVPDRVRAIKGLGYASCQAFVFAVAANWSEIHAAAEPGRLKAVWPTGGYELAIVLQWTGVFWSVTTALPFRPTGKPSLYVKRGTECEPSATTAERPALRDPDEPLEGPADGVA